MKDFFNSVIFSIDGYQLKVSSLIFLAIFIVVVFILLNVVKKSIYISKLDQGRKYSLYSLSKYFIIILAILISLQILGFNLSILLAGSAALLVGFGLGMQNLFSDYISGIIILFDSSLKVGDIIEVNDIICKVQQIDLRTTKVLARDEKYVILPNTDLTRNPLVNWTHDKKTTRFGITVGVDYSSDPKQVIEIMQTIVANKKEVVKERSPFVNFQDYADSALIFTVYFWSNHVFNIESIKSELRVDIFEAFKQNNISIPFPQRVLHMHNSNSEK